MSLQTRLWLAIVCLMSLTLAATLTVSSIFTRAYLQDQLRTGNVNSARTLALYLSRSNADPVLQGDTLEAQFSAGHYELLELRDANGRIRSRWQDKTELARVPAWFRKLLAVEVAPGVARIPGSELTLTVRGQLDRAYESAWHGMQVLTLIFFITALLAGAAGSRLLRHILRPLREVVKQATAIGERRFVTMPEPSARELRQVAHSMNALSHRVRKMVRAESSRLEKWRQDVHVDALTGLLNREHFIRLFESSVHADDADTSGVLCLLRISDLARLNQRHGRERVDAALQQFGRALMHEREISKGVSIGRLNGADFALLAAREMDAAAVGQNLQRILSEVLQEQGLAGEVQLPGASTNYRQGDATGPLLAHLEAALRNAEQAGHSEMVVMGRDGEQMMPMRHELKRWRSMLFHAFNTRDFSLATFPVSGLDGSLLHFEAPVRLHWRDNRYTAGQFLPWINRLGLADELDRAVIQLALATIDREQQPLGINLSDSAVANPGFLVWLSEQLAQHGASAGLLWLEVREVSAYRHLLNFKRLCSRCKRFGTRVGIEHLGHQLSEIGRLHDVGVDYVKVDSAFVRNVDHHPANQTLLRTLCTLAHSLGITVIAEGVESEAELASLQELGFDAVTGPHVTRQLDQGDSDNWQLTTLAS